MIFPIAMRNPPTTAICFHLIPLALLSQFKCLKTGSILTSPNSKLGEFGEVLVNDVCDHSPNWMQFLVRETKLSHNFSHLGIHGLTHPPHPQEADKAMSANAGVEGSTISMCVTTGP
jgi:hypothetical protein